MTTFLIDGNNLTGKAKIIDKNRDLREDIVLLLESYFSEFKFKVKLYFDGYPTFSIASTRLEIIFSRSQTADDLIRFEIENHKNPRTLTIVSSDEDITNLGRVCGCKVIKSETFYEMIKRKRQSLFDEKQNKAIGDKDFIELLKKKYGENIV